MILIGFPHMKPQIVKSPEMKPLPHITTNVRHRICTKDNLSKFLKEILVSQRSLIKFIGNALRASICMYVYSISSFGKIIFKIIKNYSIKNNLLAIFNCELAVHTFCHRKQEWIFLRPPNSTFQYFQTHYSDMCLPLYLSCCSFKNVMLLWQG